jgi:hypothetical protein
LEAALTIQEFEISPFFFPGNKENAGKNKSIKKEAFFCIYIFFQVF